MWYPCDGNTALWLCITLIHNNIIALAAQAGLTAIEWGGDLHLPPGDARLAAQLGRQTRDAGLNVSAYGSYYRAGEEQNPPVAAVLETALALEAPVIRVWAGRRGSDKATPDHRARVVDDLRRMAEMASAAGLLLACEYHGGTLTDTSASALQLFREVDHPALRTFWQPPVRQDQAACLAGLRDVLPWLVNLHVFHWVVRDDRVERRPLGEGATAWRAYLEMVRTTGREHCASLEFVQDAAPEAMLRDATTLKRWLNDSERL
ncbi:MAG: sugar phosphate isomerase/epimerase [Lentisphaerae bacterium]|nr:sugar phosphate isomerase/epimerase [Lentisphaerota bacterium]